MPDDNRHSTNRLGGQKVPALRRVQLLQAPRTHRFSGPFPHVHRSPSFPRPLQVLGTTLTRGSRRPAGPNGPTWGHCLVFLTLSHDLRPWYGRVATGPLAMKEEGEFNASKCR